MINCQELTEELEKGNFKPLSFKNKALIKLHLLMCTACRSYKKDSKKLDVLLKKIVPKSNVSSFTSQEKEALIQHIQTGT